MYARSVSLATASAFVCCSMAFAQMSAADQFPQETLPAWARAAGPGRHHTILKDELNHAFRIGGTQQAPSSESAIVTLHQLAHEVPGKAMKKYQRAMRAQDKGDRQSAIEHLEKAIQIDPEFCAARNDLGANYLFTNHVDLAIEQFNKTIAVDPHAARPYSNLAVAFLMQNRLGDAERAARQEMDLDRAGTRGRLALGISLVLQKKFTPEAEQSLRRAAVDFPQARLMLARVLAAHGKIESARAQLQRYLASGERSSVEVAKDWMRQLDAVSRR